MLSEDVLQTYTTCMVAISTHPVVVSAVDVSGHAEVSDLHQQPVPHQAVACRQVSVHKVLRRQVHHARCDLSGDVQHLGQTQLPVRLQRLAVDQDHGVRAVSSVRKPNKIQNISGK